MKVTNKSELVTWPDGGTSLYMFGDDGAIVQGLYTNSNGDKYYSDPNTYLQARNQIVTLSNGDSMIFGKDGKALSGLQKFNGKLYYLDPQTNVMTKNNYVIINGDGHGYMFGSDGTAQTGLQKWYGTYYYFDPDTYKLVTNKSETVTWPDGGSSIYMFGGNGAIVQGLYTDDNGDKYYSDPNTYLQARNQIVTLSNGDSMIFGKDGKALSGLQKFNGKLYYLDPQTKVMVKNATKTINGVTYTFDANGVATEQAHTDMTTSDESVQSQRSQIASSIASALSNKGTIDYDWNNQSDDYAAFSVHDSAQLVAMYQKNVLDNITGQKGNQGLKPDASTIEWNLAHNSLLYGTVENIFTKNYNVSDFKYQEDYVQKVTDDYLNQLNLSSVDGDILGIGSSYDSTTNQLVVTAILFKKGSKPAQKEQATSSVPNATVTQTWGTTISGGVSAGSTVDDTELNGALSGINSTILTGNKGEEIPSNILQLYYDAIVGAEAKTGLQGQKVYNVNGTNYHYVYWLTTDKGDVKNDAWTIFMNDNKGVKYGDPIKVEVTATATEGTPAAKPVSGVPSTKMTSDQIETAYATGSDTGASHDAVKIEKIDNYDQSLARGVDVGSLLSLEKAGVTFYNFNGQKDDLLNILQQAGVNYLRVRVWNDPYDASNDTYGGGNSDEASLIELAQRAKAHNMTLMMDFHYSDFWADPATQYVPKAWEGEDTATMAQSVYNYTKKVLEDLKATGVNVGMVQVGNEITKGILTDSISSGFWHDSSKADAACSYLSAGSKAVREVFPQAQILLHLEGMNQSNYRNIMNVWKSHNVDYDVLSTSCYPFWVWGNDQYSVWDTINGTVNMIKNEFGKKVVYTETSWPFTNENSDGTNNTVSGSGSAKLPVSVQGQVNAMRKLYSDMSNSNGEVLGAFWWEPAWIPAKAGYNYYQYNKDAGDALGTGWASYASQGYYPDSKLFWNNQPTWGGSSWDNQALFDDQGHPLQSLKMFEGFANGYTSPNYSDDSSNTPTTPTENATSTMTAVVSEIDYGDGVSSSTQINNGLSVGSTLDISQLITDDAQKLLTGSKNTTIDAGTLNNIIAYMKQNVSTGSYTGSDGATYHYVLSPAGKNTADNQRDFSLTNQNKKYGDNLTVHYTATLVKG